MEYKISEIERIASNDKKKVILLFIAAALIGTLAISMTFVALNRQNPVEDLDEEEEEEEDEKEDDSDDDDEE